MKKLLVLALVLGLATMASAADLATIAGLDYTVVGNTVTISGTLVTSFGLAMQVSDGTGAIRVGALVSPFAGSNGVVSESMFLPAGGVIGVAGLETSGAGKTQNLYVFTVDSTVKEITLYNEREMWTGDSYVARAGSGTTDLAGSTITIPEPMTIALLGLGGLFLRRKK